MQPMRDRRHPLRPAARRRSIMPSKKKKVSKKEVKKDEKVQQEAWTAINKVEKVLKSMKWPDHAYIQGALPAACRARSRCRR